MSRENVEIWRTSLDRQLAQLADGASPEATVSGMTEIWAPEIELDATEGRVLDLGGVYRGIDEVQHF